MDAFLLHGSDQQIPPPKSHIGKPPQHSFISRPYYHNFNPSNFHSMGILQTPPPFLTHSYSLPRPPPPQAPLLPLPVAFHRHCTSSTPCSNRTARDHPIKSKFPKKEGKRTPKKPSPAALTVTLTKSSTPDPNALPKNITAKVSPVGYKGNTAGIKTIGENQVDIFSGSMVFTISPPPSSLPLPSFCLRHNKLSCNAEAGGGSVDTDTSDNLRRLLQLSKRA